MTDLVTYDVQYDTTKYILWWTRTRWCRQTYLMVDKVIHVSSHTSELSSTKGWHRSSRLNHPPIKNKVRSFLNSVTTNEAKSSRTNTLGLSVTPGEGSPHYQPAASSIRKTEIRYLHGLIGHKSSLHYKIVHSNHWKWFLFWRGWKTVTIISENGSGKELITKWGNIISHLSRVPQNVLNIEYYQLFWNPFDITTLLQWFQHKKSVIWEQCHHL